jgi:hypothetical protein
VFCVEFVTEKSHGYVRNLRKLPIVLLKSFPHVISKVVLVYVCLKTATTEIKTLTYIPLKTSR